MAIRRRRRRPKEISGSAFPQRSRLLLSAVQAVIMGNNMSSGVRWWFLILVAIVLTGRVAEFQPHSHLSSVPCALCPLLDGRRKSLESDEKVLGHLAQSGGDPNVLAIPSPEVAVARVSHTVPPLECSLNGVNWLPWRSPPTIERSHRLAAPRGPPLPS